MEHAGPGRNAGDPYRLLGVSADASPRDIARAYRRAVQHAHPDAQPHDPLAPARFRALTDAYELLRHPGRRADYDQGRPGREPSRKPPGHGRTGARPGLPNSPFPLRPPPGQPIWAGPVHVEPPATVPATSQHGRNAMVGEVADPVVILGLGPGQAWGWPW